VTFEWPGSHDSHVFVVRKAGFVDASIEVKPEHDAGYSATLQKNVADTKRPPSGSGAPVTHPDPGSAARPVPPNVPCVDPDGVTPCLKTDIPWNQRGSGSGSGS